jgi:hypothetical protein
MPNTSTIRIKSYVTTVMVCGLGLIAYAATHVKAVSPAHFAGLVCAAVLASRFSLKIPRLTASLSLDVPFVILAAVQMGLSAAAIVAGVATLVQCLKPGLNKSALVKLFFNVSANSIAAAVAVASVQSFTMVGLRFAVAAAMLLAVNSVLVAFVVSLDGHGSAPKILSQLVTWSFPAYVLGGGMACMMLMSQPIMGWYVPVVATPVIVLLYQSFRNYFSVTVASPNGVPAESMQELEEVTA